MSDATYADADEHARNNVRWPVIRMSLHGAAAVLAVLTFALLVLELRGETTTSVTAWLLVGFLLVLLAGQVVLTVLDRDRVHAGVAGAGGAVVQEDAGETWDELDEAPSWDAPAETAVGSHGDADEVITIGCPACNNTFHMSESDVAGGQFHCPKCGVAGYLGE